MASRLNSLMFSLAAITSLVDAMPHQKMQQMQNSCGSQQQNQQGQQGGVRAGKAVYFITNAQENSVVALPIGNDGMLSKGTSTKTGGAGSIAINGANMQPGVPDALVGQSALTVVGNVSLLFLEFGLRFVLTHSRMSSQ